MGPLGRPHGGPGDDVGTGRMEPEPEGRGDPEVGPCAPQAPEQLGVLVFGCPDMPAVGADQLDVDEVVDRQPETPHQPAEPASQRQPGDAGMANGAVGTDQAVALGGGVESLEQGPGLHGGDPPVGLDGHLLHRTEIDHHAVVTGGEPRVAVAAAADRHHQVLVAGEPQGGDDVGGRGAAGDQCRAPVGGGVPHPPRLVVAGVTRSDQTASEALPESLQPRPRARRLDRPLG